MSEFNTASSADFITDIIKTLLKKRLSSKEYEQEDIGGSRNIFRQCVERNNGIGEQCSYALANLIIKETKYDEIKRKLVLDYLKRYLTPKENDYMKHNPDDIKIIVGFASAKFSNKNNMPDINKLHYKQNEGLRVVSLSELFNMGWTVNDFMLGIRKLWREIIPDMPDEHMGDMEDWGKIHVEHPETRKALMNKNEMIGYWEFDPLFPKIFEKAKNGELAEGEMTINDIPFLISGTYNIYFENICIVGGGKSLSKSVALRKMLHSIISTLEDLALNGVFINEICTWAYTESGSVLCKSLGLRFHKDHDEVGKVYCGTIYDLLNHSICNEFPLIKQLYGMI